MASCLLQMRCLISKFFDFCSSYSETNHLTIWILSPFLKIYYLIPKLFDYYFSCFKHQYLYWFLLFLLKTPLFHDVSFDHHLTIISIILIILNFCSCALIGLHSSIIKQPSCHNSLFSTISCDNFMLIFWNQIHCLTTLFGFIGHLF